MDALPALRLPVQSPPIWRNSMTRQGHQQRAGVDPAGCWDQTGLGDCTYPDGSVDNNFLCAECCPYDGKFWDSYTVPPVRVHCPVTSE